MKEFDYSLDYDTINFRDNPELYRIGRGEQGVLLVEPYKSDICRHWRFKTPDLATASAARIYDMFMEYLDEGDFVGADMARKFLMMGWTRARRYANHRSGRKYDENGNVKPQEPDALTSKKAISAKIFRYYRNTLTNDPTYITMRKDWRKNEHILST